MSQNWIAAIIIAVLIILASIIYHAEASQVQSDCSGKVVWDSALQSPQIAVKC